MRGDTKIMIGVFAVIVVLAVINFTRDESGHYRQQFRDRCIAGSTESTVGQDAVVKICSCAADAMVRDNDARTLKRIQTDPELNERIVAPVMQRCVRSVLPGEAPPPLQP